MDEEVSIYLLVFIVGTSGDVDVVLFSGGLGVLEFWSFGDVG